jgi:hypothetical protein
MLNPAAQRQTIQSQFQHWANFFHFLLRLGLPGAVESSASLVFTSEFHHEPTTGRSLMPGVTLALQRVEETICQTVERWYVRVRDITMVSSVFSE